MVKDELQALQLAYSALEEKNRKTIEENQELVSMQDTNLFLIDMFNSENGVAPVAEFIVWQILTPFLSPLSKKLTTSCVSHWLSSSTK